MVAPARPVERFEFTPDAAGRVTDCMARLGAERHGWINFLPGLVDDPDGHEPPPRVSAFFAQPKPTMVMCTWIPAGADRRHRDPARLGIMHTGGRAAPRLRFVELAVPANWTVEQDHPERGLVVSLPEVTDEEALGWLLRAGAALCGEGLTGTWRADVFVGRST